MTDPEPRKPSKPFRRGKSSAAGKPGGPSGFKEPNALGKKVRPGSRPPLRVFTTTFWSYPSQHYDGQGPSKATMQGDKAYVGATPSWVIWQVLTRYTRPGDVVVDPMCGSGTTLDVCNDLKRRGVGFDLAPSRDDIRQADARELPVDNNSVDFFFVDPPYSTHIEYSNDPRCIGKLDAGETASGPARGNAKGNHTGQHRPDFASENPPDQMGAAYYEAMEEVIAEAERVLKPGRYMTIYVSDSFRKEKGVKGGIFMPIGFELFAIARDYLLPVDIICVERFNAKLRRGNWHKAAEEQNFYVRGFNYALIFRKSVDPTS